MMKFLKYNLIALMVLSLALLASCKKDKPSGGTPDGKGFTAMTEQDGGNSKTHLDGVVVKWTAYDQIKVANYGGGSGSTTLTYELTEGAGNSQGIFYTGEGHADFFHPDYVAAYPAAKVTSISGNKVTFNLLATQTLGKNSFGEGCNPMVAYSSNQTLQFKNVMGALCFRFRGVDKIGSLRLTSKNTADKLWGTCEVTVGSNGVPTSTSITNTVADQHIITLNCNGIKLNHTTDSLFYIMLPPGTLASGFTLEVLDENGTVFYSHDGSIRTSTEYPEGYIVRNRVIKPSNHLYLKVGAIHSKFTINSSGDKVYFSKGNLQYNKTTSKWSFMDSQYERAEDPGDIVKEDYEDTDIVSLFGWGTSGYNNIVNDPLAEYYYPNATSAASYTITTGDPSETVYDPNNRYHYGPSLNMSVSERDIAGTNYDWGVNNPIQNGGDIAGQWRTLTAAEWTYLLFTRSASTVNGTANARYAKATVSGMKGVILFPDSYVHPDGVSKPKSTSINKETVDSDENIYSASDWTAMENAGCVFLIANGWRGGLKVSILWGTNVDCIGNYWSSTHADEKWAWGLTFNDAITIGANHADAIFQVDGIRDRYNGFAVRLVRDIN